MGPNAFKALNLLGYTSFNSTYAVKLRAQLYHQRLSNPLFPAPFSISASPSTNPEPLHFWLIPKATYLDQSLEPGDSRRADQPAGALAQPADAPVRLAAALVRLVGALVGGSGARLEVRPAYFE